ncbi:MAG: lysylphosphatidylglycerol synthase transmembrane domain-containing protein [Candidatus Heimdallarchaeaceae archaeon]
MSQEKRRRILKVAQTILSIAVTVGLIIYLIWKFKPSQLAVAISGISLYSFAITILIVLTLFCIKTFRWSYILSKLSFRIKWHKSFRLILIGMFGAAITPSKVGDLIRAHYVAKETEKKETDAFFSVILDRIMDLASVAIYSLIALPFFFRALNRLIQWGVVFGITVIVLLSIVMFDDRIVKWLIAFVTKLKKTSGEKKVSLKQITQKYYANLNYFSKGDYFAIFLLSLLFWLLLGIQASILLFSMSAEPFNFQSILIMTGITTLASIVALAPLSISGVGIRDTTITLLAVYSLNIAPEIALSIAFIQTALNVFLPGLVGGLLMLYQKGENKNERKSKLYSNS